MSDFPTDQLPLFVSTYSEFGPSFFGGMGVAPAVSNTWVANQAVYLPMMIPWEYPVNRVFWVNGSTVTTSNVDFGIYTPSGQRLYSTGSTSIVGNASIPQYVTPSVPFVLSAGLYYFAYTCDSTTNRFFGNLVSVAAQGAIAGLLSQASALPLPSAATFATYASPGLPLCGITRTQSGF